MEYGGVLLGQIIDIATVETVKNIPDEYLKDHAGERWALVNVIHKMDSAEFLSKWTPNPRPSADNYPDVPFSIQEVIPTATNLQMIPVRCIDNVAFLFHILDVHNLKRDIAGMGNIYIYRSRIDCKSVLDYSRYPNQKLKPFMQPFFSRFGIETYSKRIWNFLCTCKEEMSKLTNGAKNGIPSAPGGSTFLVSVQSVMRIYSA